MPSRLKRDVGEIDVDALIAEHGEQMLRVARRFSECAADAEDAFQRAMEKLLTKAPRGGADNLPAWLSTVVRNEALTIRRRRRWDSPDALATAADQLSAPSRTPEESALANERLAGQREALRRMKPEHLRCMLLRADGLSQNQISDATGFSVAKVQRNLWEGRRAYTSHVARIESGAECRRIEPMISAYADGAISAARLADVELHLHECLACRGVLKAFRAAPTDVAALFPVGLVLAAGARLPRWPIRAIDGLQNWVGERFTLLTGGGHGAEVTFVKKAAVAAALSTSLVAGGIGAERVARLAQDDRAGVEQPAANVVPQLDPQQQHAAGDLDRPTGSSGATGALTDPPAADESDLIDASSAAVAAEQDEHRATATDPSSGLPGDTVDALTSGDVNARGPANGDAPSDAELLGGGG